MLKVVPGKAFSGRVQMKARCAMCGTVSVVRPRAAARAKRNAGGTCPAQPPIGAAAQPAAVADAALRPRDRWHFENRYPPIAISIYRGGAAKRQPVGRQLSNIPPIRYGLHEHDLFPWNDLCADTTIVTI